MDGIKTQIQMPYRALDLAVHVLLRVRLRNRYQALEQLLNIVEVHVAPADVQVDEAILTTLDQVAQTVHLFA